ncbi:MAG TPA: hypothetical protein VFY93_05875 [Planctomycetota bacterium]|nr:hypothetical protein [Planctomycetota bacterium]
MKRILLIPVAGTIAALAMIVYARQPREPKTTHPDLAPFDFPDAPEHAAPPEPGEEEPVPEGMTPEEPGPEETAPEKEPAPEALEYQLRLEADGSISDTESGRTYAGIDDLAKALGTARHTLVITNADGVPKSALDEAEVRLRDRYSIRKVYRAAEAPPGEGR